MTATAWSVFVVLSAITFALVYSPLLAKMTVALATPYPKADVWKRLLAAIVDGMLVATALSLYGRTESPAYLFAAAAYLLFRDAVRGRSVGKFCCGLVVMDLNTARPCGLGPSLRRNVIFVLPGANLVAVFLEGRTILRDPQGQRLGDRFALTQVVEGFGAKDVVAAVQEWWMDFVAHLDRSSRRPRRAPVRVPYSSK